MEESYLLLVYDRPGVTCPTENPSLGEHSGAQYMLVTSKPAAETRVLAIEADNQCVGYICEKGKGGHDERGCSLIGANR